MTSRLGSADAVVVGGGVIGAACAEALARAGLRVALIERLGLAAGASSACQSGIGYGLHLSALQLGYHRAAIDAYRLLAEDGADIDYERRGGLVVGQPATDEGMRAAVPALAEAGFAAAWADRAALDDLEPALSPQLAGAVHLADLATVSPMKVVVELARRAQQRGAAIHVETELLGVRRRAGRVTGAVTSRGTIAAGWLVIAGGAWSREAGARCGLHVPVWPLKGHVLVTEPASGMVRHYLSDASYEATVEAIRSTRLGPDGPPIDGTAHVATVIQPLPSGSYLIGSSREFAGFDRDLNRQRLRDLADHAHRLVPALGRLRLLRAYAGLRPWSPDGRPLIGRTNVLNGLALATGHAGDGNTGALITGRLLAADLTESPSPLDLSPYSPDRFALAASAATSSRQPSMEAG